MIKSILQHAQNQGPLVSHAWRITTTKLKPFRSPFEEEVANRPLISPEANLTAAPGAEPTQANIEQASSTHFCLESRDNYHSLGCFWLSSLFPVRRGIFNPRSLFPDIYQFPKNKIPYILQQVNDAWPNLDLQVLRYEIYKRDGGGIIELGVPKNQTPLPLKEEEIFYLVKRKIQEANYHAPLTLNAVDFHKIHGTPWVNDLSSPFPLNSLTLEIYDKSLAFQPALEHHLYEIFRRYGHIVTLEASDRTMKDNKPLQYHIRYRRIPGSIAARICLHRANYFKLIGATDSPQADDKNAVLVLNYERFDTSNVFKSAYTRHPRIAALLFGLGVALLSFTIIDPMRKFFVWRKMSSQSSMNEKKRLHRIFTAPYRFVSSGFSSIFGREKDNYQIEMPHQTEQRLKQYLESDTNTILYMTGPAGTGKSQLARKALSQYQPQNSVLLDFEELLKFAEEEKMIRELANKVGFYPAFGGIELLGSMIDAVTPGAGRAAISSSQSKTHEILKTMTEVMQWINRGEGKKPLIVIDGFTDTEQAKDSVFMKTVLQYLDLWVQYRIARVIFVADTTFEATGGLTALLPNVKVERLVFGDLPESSAYELMEKKITATVDEEHLREAVSILGGRLGDMGAYLNRVNSGQSSETAIGAIIDTSKEDIKSILFEHKNANRSYNITQLWKVLAVLAEKKKVTYDFVLFTIFKGDDRALRSLIQTRLFSMDNDSDHEVDTIMAGSPVVQRAFEEIYQDSLIRPGMELYVARSGFESEQKLLQSYEEELVNIRNSGFVNNPMMGQRVEFLLAKFKECQDRIEAYDKAINDNTDLLKRSAAAN